MAVVFVIEDDDDLRGSLVEMLEGAGYEVWQAKDGRQAMQRLNASAISTPDAIVTDFLMPQMNGLELLIALEAQSATAIPAVLMTAATERKLPGLRGVHVLHKPHLDELLPLLDRVLKGAGGSPTRGMQ